MTSSAPAATAGESTALAKDRLGIPAVLYFILSAMAPMTVVAGVVTTLYAVTGLSAIGAAFIAVALVLAGFAVGYVAMARYITNAGALYAYISRGLGRPLGVGAALVAALAYNLLQVGLYGMFGPTLAGYLADKVGWDLSWWVYSLGAWLLVALLGVLRVDLNSRVLAVLLCAEVAVLLVLAVAGLSDPAAGVPLTSLSPGGLFGHAGVGALLVTALLGYVGFEAAAVFSEEARVPRRTVPVAVYTSLALIGATYALASWAMSVHYGDDQVAAVAAQQGPAMLFTMSGSVVAEIATVLFMTSLFAAMISFHNAVARYMFALGRERVLPGALGRTHPRSGAPHIASLAQSVIGLAVIVVYALAGWDPTVRLFFWLGTTGAFGVLCLLAITSIAVIRFFARDSHGENAWRRLVAPVLAALALLAMVWAGLANYTTLLGVTPGSTEAWALPASFAVAAIVGVVYGLWLRSARPNVYQGIGFGADALADLETKGGSRAEPQTPVTGP
jgi:amino acid transporter